MLRFKWEIIILIAKVEVLEIGYTPQRQNLYKQYQNQGKNWNLAMCQGITKVLLFYHSLNLPIYTGIKLKKKLKFKN